MLCSYIQRWSTIKNSAEDVSDERAIDAFSEGLCHSDLVEEIGRTRPVTVAELMEQANKFADGEDTYHNKRGHSPEVDRTRRQKRRHHSGGNQRRRNQIAAGYTQEEREEDENRRFKTKGEEKSRYSGPSAEDMLHGPCRHSLRVPRRKKGLESPDERLQNVPKVARRYGLKSRRKARGKEQKSRISNTKTIKAPRVESIHISHDTTGAQVEERTKEHIQAGKPSNIITTSYHRVPTMVRATSQV
jgi:hypothetical protein